MIHSDLIDATREDVLRLIGKQHHLLTDLSNIPNLLVGNSEDGQQRTDLMMVNNWQSILINEAKKVDQLEIILTVLGTMKAGKSTTINAIVGYEVLPNRNYPMTTLPTLIRHKKGQKEPILIFSNRDPIEKLVVKVRESLKTLVQDDNIGLIDLTKQDDGQEIVDGILNGDIGNFEEVYTGQKNIFSFLKSLNDLIRLSQDINKLGPQIDLPFEHYKSIDDFPLIEVEFCHLSNLSEFTKGNFSLLDTPGPNDELLGTVLRQVFDSQIERSSAILAILDYTQLGGEAGAEIRRQLTNKASKAIEERSFFLVNKFDQKQKNGMKSQEVKRHVAGVELKGKISEDKVYPVSALCGYLANRALYEINNNGCLPEHELDGWVADFGKVAMGETWDPESLEVDEIKVSAERVWKSSRFDAPIQEVIVKAASNAAIFSMQAAVDRMIEFGNKLENFLNIQQGSLTKTVEEIRQLIDNLSKDIENVGIAESKVEKELNSLISNSLDVVQLQYKKTKEKLRLTLEGYFEEGKRLEADQLIEKFKKLEEEYEEQVKQLQLYQDDFHSPFHNFFREFFGGASREKDLTLRQMDKIKHQKLLVQESSDFDPQNPQVKFESERVARFFLRQINEKINSIINDSSKEFEFSLKNLSRGLEETIPEILVEGVGSILENAKERLQDEGFSLIFNVPEPNINENQIDMSNILSVSNIDSSRRTLAEKRWRAKDGWFNAAKRKLGDFFSRYDWGYEYQIEEKTEEIYIVDMSKVQENVLASLDENIDLLRNSSQNFWDITLKPLVKDYFDELKNYLEIFRGDLKDGISKHRLDEIGKEKLSKKIQELKELAELHSQDVLTIKNNIS